VRLALVRRRLEGRQQKKGLCRPREFVAGAEARSCLKAAPRGKCRKRQLIGLREIARSALGG
jgi:hypothetical protein